MVFRMVMSSSSSWLKSLIVAYLCLSGSVWAQPAAKDLPRTPEQRLNEAKQLLDAGQVKDGLARLKALETEGRKPAGLSAQIGIGYYKAEAYNQAAPYLRRAIEEAPDNKEAIQLLGLSLFRIGKPAEAIPLLKQVTAWYSSASVDASYVLGLSYIQVQNYPEARKAFAAMYGVPEESAVSYLFFARMLLRQGYDPVAEENAKKAVALDPKLPLAHYLLGELYMFKSRLPEAIQEFEAEVKLNPAFAGTYDRLGDAYTRDGRFEDAQRMLQRAVVLDPNSTGPYIQLGKVLLKKNDPKTALMYLERAVQMDASNFITHHLLGQAYRGLGQESDAEREFKRAEELQRNSR
jgi:tetratricopeptide (TPR) repeat protein